VWFGYDPLAPVVKDVSLKIRKGEKVGIVGQSGSGKTTLIKLLLRFYDPLAGKILIDGYDLKDIDLKNYRSQIGIVHADPTLLYGTVAYNIAYGKQDAKPEEIIAAAMMSKAHDFIIKLPLAYDTHLGERGNRLSSGQKQMIAIARALIKEPKLLIMDEPTANVDSITEGEIIKSLREAMQGKTTIIISHRFSILKYVDRIIVMDNGKVIEEGKRDDLLQKKGKFYEIFGDGDGSREIYKETQYS
jgi:ABC-type multidrug transport system fused ATPase/permease subunit